MKRNILFTLVSLSIFFTGLSAFPVNVSAQTKQQLKAAKKLTDEGDQAFRQRNYQAALDKYTAAVGVTANNSYAHFWKGHSHYYLKQYSEAVGEFDTALAQGYKPGPVYSLRWYSNYELKKYDDALADLQKAFALNPKDPLLQEGFGDVYLAQGKYAEALAAYQKAAPSSPNKGNISYNVARVHHAQNNYKEQAAAADAAIKGNTQFLGEAYFLLGEAEQKQGNLGEATAAYERSIAAQPNNYPTYRNAADAYRGQGRFPEAISVLKKSFIPFPSRGETYTELSWYYSLAGRDNDALEAAVAGVKLSPSNPAAHTNLCRAYNGTKQFQLAISSCNAALRLSPNDGETYFYLGRAQDSLGKTADASRSYKKAVAGLTEYTTRNPDFTDGFYLLGNALFSDNQLDKAVEAIKKALELSPRFAKARYNLGILYLTQKKKALASEQYNELMKFDKEQAGKLKAEIDKL